MRTSNPKPRRRWYQFGLRTLLVGVLVFFVAFGGWLAIRHHQAQVNRNRVNATKSAIAWIEEVRGAHDATTKTLRPQTWLEEAFGDPDDAENPSKAVDVSQVVLRGTQVTDAGLEHRKRLNSP